MTSLGPIVRAVSLILSGLYTCCCWLGWHLFTHPPNKRKRISNPVSHRCTPFPENMSFNPETIAKCWAVWAWTCPRSVWLTNDRWGADITNLTLKYWVNYRNHQLYWRGKLCGQSCHFCAKCHSYQGALSRVFFDHAMMQNKCIRYSNTCGYDTKANT